MSIDCISDYMYEYEASDINTNAVVVKVIYSGIACGPVSFTKIFIISNLSELADLYECLIRSDLEVDFYDLDTYVSNVINKNSSFKKLNLEDHDELLSEYLNWQRQRVDNANDDFPIIIEIINDYGAEGKVEELCYLAQYIQDSDNQDYLVDHLDLDDDNLQENLILKLPGSEELIAQAINQINEFS